MQRRFFVVTRVGLTVVLCMLGVLCGLWSSRYVRHPSGLRFWPLAVILAAAAVLFAPMVPVWWLLLAALTGLLLYAVHFGGGKQYSPAALRTWGRLAAVLLVCVTVLGGWNQDAARPAVVDTAANWAAEQVDTLRYGSNAGLPEGDMTKVGPRQISGDTMLEVTMTQPTSYYLRGFVGETYANSRWSTLDSKTLSEDADTFYWLHQDGFYAQSQLTTAAQAGVPDALRYDNTVTVQNIGASGKYLYAPYELLADSDVLDAAQIGDRTLLASGLRGQRFYSFHASDNIITQYQRLAAALLEETEQTNAFLNTEAAYNRFVYDHYTDIPDDVRGFLEEKLGGYQKDEGQVHFDYQRAKQNILFYLTTYITYEENVLPITGGDFALTFLDGTQSGYDVHYATAAALMFRYYGIPARYVEGYLVTKDDAAHMKSGQTLDVGGNRAHAWVEYYQDGLGWLPFEATPTYFSAMEKAEQYQNISGLVGQAPLDYTADNLDDAELENPAAEALREFWLKHRLTILLTLAVLLAAGMVGLLIGWLIFERRRTKKRKEGFFGADAAASIDAIFRYMMDVLRARGMAAKNCPPADYVSYMDEDLREEYLAAAKLWQEARFRGKPMQELQRRRVLRLKDEIWERTWHSASLKERLRLKYVEFL